MTSSQRNLGFLGFLLFWFSKSSQRIQSFGDDESLPADSFCNEDLLRWTDHRATSIARHLEGCAFWGLWLRKRKRVAKRQLLFYIFLPPPFTGSIPKMTIFLYIFYRLFGGFKKPNGKNEQTKKPLHRWGLHQGGDPRRSFGWGERSSRGANGGRSFWERKRQNGLILIKEGKTKNI